MKKTIFALLPLSVALAGPGLADDHGTSLAFDANVEIDTDAVDRRGQDTEYDMGGRLELNVFGEHRVGEHFVRGRGTALLKKDGEVATDDMWGMVGGHRWDVQIGRFEAFDLFPLGKDTIVEHAEGASVYQANAARGRASDGGQLAAHFHPSEALSFELASLYGEGDGTRALSGVRPAVRYAGPGFSVTGGFEHVKYDDEDNGVTETVVDHDGYGVTLGIDLAGAWLNLNAAYKDDNLGDDVTTLGANVTYGRFGLGYINSREHVSGETNPQINSFYAAYTVPFFGFENANVTLAATTSQANSAAGSDEVHGARVRFFYAF